MKKYTIVALTLFLFTVVCLAQPVSNNPQVVVSKLLTIPNNGVRVAIDKKADRMYFITSHDNPKTNNEIYEVLNFRNPNPTFSAILADKTNHGMTEQMTGLVIHQGVMYVCGSSDFPNSKVVGYIKKTTLPLTNASTWTTVMESAPYNKSNSAFDHRMSELTIDPTGEYLYLNSGSKSDHGEMNNGERDVALTAKVFRIPINAVNLILPNNNTNAPYVFADGIRNSFGLAFDANANLFGTENGGDRDHNEELNWLRKGHHYGFPWRIGGSNNPQQYSNYQPGTSSGQWFNNNSLDFMIQSNRSVAWVQYQSFKNDPTFPQIPEGLVFTEAVVNLGPHADLYRDTTNFYSQSSSVIKNASTVAGSKMITFSPHLSPCGIIFDKERALSGNFKGSGFLVFGNGGGMAEAFADGSGNSLAQIKLTYDPNTNNYKTTTTNIVRNFKAPLGVELSGNDIYVIEHYGVTGNTAGIYKVSFPNRLEIPLAAGIISIDGIGNDMDWNYASWQNLDNLWVDNVSANQNTMPKPDDISGRFKTLWKGNKIYVLAEITDDILDGKMPGDNPLVGYPDFDGLQVFINQSNSKAMHERNNKAFNLHISNQGDVVDLRGDGNTSWDPGFARLFNDVAKSKIVHNGTLHTWEVEVTVYDSTYNELLTPAQNAGALVNLTANKSMGISIAFNDRDGSKGNPVGRRFMIGSNNIAGTTNNARNIPWQNASVFGQAILIGQPIALPEFELETSQLLLRNDKDSSVNIKIISMTDSKLVYNILPLVTFANVSINSVSKSVVFNYNKTVTGTQIFTISGTNGFATAYKFINVSILGEVPTPSFIITKPNVFIKSNRDSSIIIPIFSNSSNAQVRYTFLPLVTFANITINSVTGTVNINYLSNKLGNGVFTITGRAGMESYSQTFTVSIIDMPSFIISNTNVVLKSNRDSTISIPITSFSTNSQIRYSVLPLVTFANMTINSITGTVTIKYSANKLGSRVFTLTGTSGADSFSQIFTVSVVEKPSFVISNRILILQSNRDSTITIPITSFSPGIQVRYTVLPVVTFANLTINSVTGLITIKYTANKLGNGVFTLTGTSGVDSFSQIFTISVVGIPIVTSVTLPLTEGDNNVKIFPNPATRTLNVQCVEGINRIKLINIQGIQQFEWNINYATQAELNVESVAKGLYFLHISTDNEIFIRKLAIQ